MITTLLSYADKSNVANEAASQGSFTSFNLVELATALILFGTLILTIRFWYATNRPNIIVKQVARANSAIIVITNEGLQSANNLRITCNTFKLSEDPDETFDIRFPAMQPKEQLEYFVAATHEAVKFPPYNIAVVHDKWGIPWWKERREFVIDFKKYAYTLTSHNMPTRLEQDIRQIAQMGHILIKSHINKVDQRRVSIDQVKSRVKQLTGWTKVALRRVFRQNV
ncbi:MAG: hypothetical protein OXH54_01140 [Acidimicrobiaceae bacterium]|nr:hypothetical protein [Acidimicrobiaceae bacterium]